MKLIKPFAATGTKPRGIDTAVVILVILAWLVAPVTRTATAIPTAAPPAGAAKKASPPAAPAAPAVIVGPVNPQASPEARKLLSYLYSISGKSILSGQHNYTMNRSQYSDKAAQMAGKYPAVWGSDFGHGAESLATRQEMINEAKRQHAKGSIITLMWHAVRPVDEETAGWKESVQNQLSEAQWTELITPGTPLHRRWLTQVDGIATYLKQLRDARVPVLWRPYHEMNGGWFWWGNKKGEQGYTALWRLMHERLTTHHGLSNLLWVWNANAPNEWAGPYADYYPGPAYVDVLAVDVYEKDFKPSHYDDLLKLARGKPVALGEVGQMPDPSVLDTQPRWAWFMTWPSHLEQNNTPEQVKFLYEYPRVLTLDEVRLAQSTEAQQATPVKLAPIVTMAPMPPLKRGNEVAGAKWVVARVRQAKTLPELADALSNRTAAGFGMLVITPISMGAAMADGTPKGVLKPGDLAVKLQTEYRALMNRYRMLDNKGELTDDPKALDRLYGQQGRRFLLDVDAAIERLIKAGQLSGDIPADISEATPTNMMDQVKALLTPSGAPGPEQPEQKQQPRSLVYRVLGSRRVAIADARQPKETLMEVLWQDGKWRVHLEPEPEEKAGKGPTKRPAKRSSKRPIKGSSKTSLYNKVGKRQNA